MLIVFQAASPTSPSYPADTAHCLILPRRAGVACLKIPGKAIQVDEPDVPGIDEDNLPGLAEPAQVTWRHTKNLSSLLDRGHLGIAPKSDSIFHALHPLTAHSGYDLVPDVAQFLHSFLQGLYLPGGDSVS